MANDLAKQTVTATDLGAVLGLTARRVRQLAEEGVIPRAARGRYELAACVQAYVETIRHAAAGEPSDLRAERIELVRAQRRKIEHELSQRRSTEADFAWQDALIDRLRVDTVKKLQAVSGWLHDLLLARIEDSELSRVIAAQVHYWVVAVCSEYGEELRIAAAEARARGVTIHEAWASSALARRDVRVRRRMSA